MKLKNKPLVAALIATIIFTSGCALTREEGGALIGAVVGGVVGNQVGDGRGKNIATAVGIFAGAMAGSSIGKSLDATDAANAQAALEKTPTGQSSSWVNPDSGNAYSVTPTRTYQGATGKYCREYQSSVTIDGKQQRAYGTACRQPDGSWKII